MLLLAQEAQLLGLALLALARLGLRGVLGDRLTALQALAERVLEERRHRAEYRRAGA